MYHAISLCICQRFAIFSLILLQYWGTLKMGYNIYAGGGTGGGEHIVVFRSKIKKS